MDYILQANDEKHYPERNGRLWNMFICPRSQNVTGGTSQSAGEAQPARYSHSFSSQGYKSSAGSRQRIYHCQPLSSSSYEASQQESKQKWFAFRFGTFHQSSCIRKFLTSSNLHRCSCAAVAGLHGAAGDRPRTSPGGWRGARLAPSCRGGGIAHAASQVPCSIPGHGQLVLLCAWCGQYSVLIPAELPVHPHGHKSRRTLPSLGKKQLLVLLFTLESE
ncbi:uncharacterized protein LOC128914225 [Rissa tridactyla]|uniref:uncharacterized protein LOC128914225 n=1 Tax=Rissa tridactyla TaxID=75485 RepID=UPI0023BA76A4|nr:uncharacterized protein LOC128914225 [Rissa tridactyla]